MLLGVAEIDGIHAEPDVGRVLPGNGPSGNIDQLNRRLVKGSFIIGILGPIGIGLLHNDLPFFNQAFEDFLDIEAFVFFALEPQGEVFKVDEDRQGSFSFSHLLVLSRFREFYSAPETILKLIRTCFAVG